jgi:hypothetical protein
MKGVRGHTKRPVTNTSESWLPGKKREKRRKTDSKTVQKTVRKPQKTGGGFGHGLTGKKTHSVHAYIFSSYCDTSAGPISRRKVGYCEGEALSAYRLPNIRGESTRGNDVSRFTLQPPLQEVLAFVFAVLAAPSWPATQ